MEILNPGSIFQNGGHPAWDQILGHVLKRLYHLSAPDKLYKNTPKPGLYLTLSHITVIFANRIVTGWRR